MSTSNGPTEGAHTVPRSALAQITRPWLLTTIAMGLVALMELGRELVVARRYGAGPVSDAFYLGIALSQTVGGAFHALGLRVILPWFCLSMGKSRQAAHVQMSGLVLLLLIPIAAVAAVSGLWAGTLARWMGGPAVDQAMLADVLRYALPVMALLAQSSVLVAYLNARQAYGLAELRGLVNAVCFVLVLLVLPRAWAAAGLGLAYLAGGLCELVWLWLWARPSLVRLRTVETREQIKALRGLFGTALLPSVAFVSSNLGQSAERVMAGHLTVGSVALLSYSRRMTTALIRILSQGINTIVRSKASLAHASGAKRETSELLQQGFRLLLLVLVPVAALVVVLRVPITRLLFESNVFQTERVGTMASLLGWYMLAVPMMGLLNLLLTAFWSRGDTTTPSIQQLGLMVANLTLDLIAVRYLGVLGFAVAYVGTQVLAVMLAAVAVHRRVLQLEVWRDWRFFSRLALLAGGAAGAASLVFRLVASVAPTTKLGGALALGAAGSAGALVFVLLGILSGVQEVRTALRWLVSGARKRIGHLGS
jgi:putative peptidoglycan lipid II flippase